MKVKKSTIIWIIILIIDIIAGSYLAIYESYRYRSNNMLYGLVMIGLGISFILILGFKKWNRAVHGLVALLLFVPFFIGVKKLQNNFLNNQIRNYGVFTFGQVIGVETTMSRGHKTYYAVVKYKSGDKFIIQWINNDNNTYQENDSLKIIYSSVKPEIFTVTDIITLASRSISNGAARRTSLTSPF